ncbi:ATP12 family chaperone protein [Pseudogemmobacter sonorensis]|uniref:ATP12 family chaperone protein n=1 Tax=Pseudogemmobacter sonorensis TaxID=2989681 RepID=UPI00369F1691
MADWAPKRFWSAVEVTEPAEAPGRFTVRLDGRPVKTPAKAALLLPTRAMAEAVAREWEAQEGPIRPETMPATRAANSAIDKLSLQAPEVRAMLAEYGGSDLLCYRVEAPAALAARQARAWDPQLDWAEAELGARLSVTVGLMPVAQDHEAVARLAAPMAALSDFELAAFHDLVAISGSLVLALAVIRGRLSAPEAFALSRLDENWQSEQWGRDDEAEAAEALRREAFLQADRFFALCR